MANAPKVLQPYWLIILPLDVPDLTASLLLWGPSGQRWRCLWTFLFSNVPTFTTSRLQEVLAAKGGTTWARNGRWILPENSLLSRNIQGSFTCSKFTTWDRRLYFPSEGRRAEDFFALKNPTASVGFEPANLDTKGQHATSRPPKPLSVCYFTAYLCVDSLWFKHLITQHSPSRSMDTKTRSYLTENTLLIHYKLWTVDVTVLGIQKSEMRLSSLLSVSTHLLNYTASQTGH